MGIFLAYIEQFMFVECTVWGCHIEKIKQDYPSKVLGSAGGGVTSNVNELQAILNYPNVWLYYMEYLQDPARLQQYFNTWCKTQMVTAEATSIKDVSQFFKNVTEIQQLPAGSELQLCIDDFEAWDELNMCVCYSSHLSYFTC